MKYWFIWLLWRTHSYCNKVIKPSEKFKRENVVGGSAAIKALPPDIWIECSRVVAISHSVSFSSFFFFPLWNSERMKRSLLFKCLQLGITVVFWFGMLPTVHTVQQISGRGWINSQFIFDLDWCVCSLTWNKRFPVAPLRFDEALSRFTSIQVWQRLFRLSSFVGYHF